MNTKKITLINHSSVLIQQNKKFILTDPWYEKPAFGSWLSVPPMVYNPTYFLALARSVKDFYILISHGHDDHFDDDFLSMMPKETKVLIPEYKSKGLKKRIQKCGISNIIEFNTAGLKLDGFVFKSYIFHDISMDDALITISCNDFIVAHANDNWQKLPEKYLNSIKEDFLKFEKENTLYMSQTNHADGFPMIYTNYSSKEKNRILKNRQEKIICQGVKNAISVNAGAFLSYAGMSLPFIKNKEEYLEKSYCKSFGEISKMLSLKHIENKIVLNMSPGDSYDFKNVTKLFDGIDLNHNQIKNSSIDYYKKYNKINNCNTYKEGKNISKERKKFLLNAFMENLKLFVTDKFEKTNNFQKDVFNISLTFLDKDLKKEISFIEKPDIRVKFRFDSFVLESILEGNSNWESCYIGYESNVEVNGDYNINSIIRWLSMFGYVYQNRIYPSLRHE